MLDTRLAYLLDPDHPNGQSSAPGSADQGADERVLFDAYSEAVSSVVETVGPAVVRVDTRERVDGKPRGGTGSGVVISPDGWPSPTPMSSTARARSACRTPRGGPPRRVCSASIPIPTSRCCAPTPPAASRSRRSAIPRP